LEILFFFIEQGNKEMHKKLTGPAVNISLIKGPKKWNRKWKATKELNFIHNHSKFHIPPYTHRDQELNIGNYQSIASSFRSKTGARPKDPWPCKTSLHK